MLNWTFTGNVFGGSQARPDVRYDALLLQGTGLNTITANQISSPDTPHRLRAPIELRDKTGDFAPGPELPDVFQAT